MLIKYLYLYLYIQTHLTLKIAKKKGRLLCLHSVYPVPVKMYYKMNSIQMYAMKLYSYTAWKNMIFWHKIVIFHTKYPQNFRASLQSAQFFKVCPLPKLSLLYIYTKCTLCISEQNHQTLHTGHFRNRKLTVNLLNSHRQSFGSHIELIRPFNSLIKMCH